jgi:hypothetical protein
MGRLKVVKTKKMNRLIKKMQSWYLENCDGDWEHGNGFRIENIGNPGWRIDIDLIDTNLADKVFNEIDLIERSEHDWVHCRVENNVFMGRGGPENLEEILEIFFKWQEE